jgi:hypothetical protein
MSSNIDPQNDVQMLTYWAAMPNLPQKDVNTPGTAPQACARDGPYKTNGTRSFVREYLLENSCTSQKTAQST